MLVMVLMEHFTKLMKEGPQNLKNKSNTNPLIIMSGNHNSREVMIEYNFCGCIIIIFLLYIKCNFNRAALSQINIKQFFTSPKKLPFYSKNFTPIKVWQLLNSTVFNFI